MKAIALIIAAFLSVINMMSCGDKPGTPHGSAVGIADRVTQSEDRLVDFDAGKTDGFFASHGYGNAFPFDCEWSENNVDVSDGVMSMSVSSAGDKYYGGEYRSNARYSYGYYSVCMKAAACSGVISSFFTYTNHPWDEIDIEFLGDDTTKVQFNYYTNGAGKHEYVHRLGFDASEDFHEYGFDWRRDAIVFYVDGRAIYKADKDIPTTSARIMANVWNGKGDTYEKWCGKLDTSSLPATARYKWIAYSAAQ